MGVLLYRPCIILARLIRTAHFFSSVDRQLVQAFLETGASRSACPTSRPKMRPLLYFAYGSNMCISRFQKRAPNAKAVSVGRLSRHHLVFHKRGVDGSGKCTIWQDESSVHQVFGVLYLMDEADKALLDREEGVGNGYESKIVEVITAEGWMTAHTYIASESHYDSSLVPFQWYLDYVLTGAFEHRLPEYYISSFRDVTCIKDPDRERAFKNGQILRAA